MGATILTLHEACAELRVSEKTLRAILARGELLGRKVGAQWRIRADDLTCFHTHPATAIRIILWGGYTEEIDTRIPGRVLYDYRRLKPGHIGIVRPELSRPARLQGYQIEVDHTILFRHYYTAGDTSLTTSAVDTIVLAVLDKFNNTFAIVPQAEMTGPPEVTWPVLWMLAETFLVWRTEIRVPIKELYVIQ